MAFSYIRTVYLADTDAAGVVYFARVMNICHEAYEESLHEVGINLQQFLINSTVAIPIVEANVNFFQPMFCGDRLLVELVGKQLSEHKFALDYQIFSAKVSKSVLAKCSTVHVCINPQTRSRANLSESITQWLQAFT